MAEKLQKFSKTSTRPEKPAICPDCGIGFSRQPDISRHITPKITCPVKGCHKSFRKDKKHDFMSHVGREHPGLNSERANGYFKAHREASVPFPSLCVPEGSGRTPSEPHLIQTPAHQPQFSTMPLNDGLIDRVNFSHALSLPNNTYNGGLQSFDPCNPSSWQNPMAVKDHNLGMDMFDPLLDDIYHDQPPKSPADSRFTQPK